MIFSEISTGAGNDIEQATEMARKMVCEWGMSDTLGPLTYGKKEEQIFLGKEFNRHQDYTEATALKIDAEIKRIVTEQYERAHDPHRPPGDPRRRGGAARARGAGRGAAEGDGGGAAGRDPRRTAAVRHAGPPRATIEHEGGCAHPAVAHAAEAPRPRSPREGLARRRFCR